MVYFIIDADSLLVCILDFFLSSSYLLPKLVILHFCHHIVFCLSQKLLFCILNLHFLVLELLPKALDLGLEIIESDFVPHSQVLREHILLLIVAQ